MLQTLNRFTGTALVLVLTATTATAQIPCVDGNAGGYPCQNIDLMGYLSSDEVGGGDMNDIWVMYWYFYRVSVKFGTYLTS